MVSPSFQGVSVGGQLGNLEYLIDSDAVRQYRCLVGADGSFANLMADDCVSLAQARFPDLALSVIWRRFEFYRPPVLDRRIQVGAWLKGIEARPEGPLLRISAFAVDDIGTEIMRSEAAVVVGATGVDNRRESARPAVEHPDASPTDPEIQVGTTINLGCWVTPDTTVQDSIFRAMGAPVGCSGQNMASMLLAGWLEGRLGRIFGDDFRWGGRLALTCQAPLTPGATLAASAVVADHERDHSGTEKVVLVLGINDACSLRVATGLAAVFIPSPRLF